jgi:hypothetical protein
MWPNLFLVGAMKAGTTSIASALSLHPQVFVPLVKEPNFFCSDLYEHGLGAGAETADEVLKRVRRGESLHHAYVQDRDCYLALFEGRGSEDVVADCSTTYLYSATAAENIVRVCPASKIIISLRNPIERAFSEFLMNCSIGTAPPSFSAALDLEERELKSGSIPLCHRYVSASLYWKQVDRYLRAFGTDHVLVLRFENIQQDFGNIMARVCKFIEVAPGALTSEIKKNEASFPRAEKLNRWLEASGLKEFVRRKVPQLLKERMKRFYYAAPPLDIKPGQTDVERLKRIFAPDIARLSELLGEDFMGWLDCRGRYDY